jgi:hypothetical protein
MARRGLANIPGMARVPAVVVEDVAEEVAEEAAADVAADVAEEVAADVAKEDENKAAATVGGTRHRHNGKYYKVRIGKRGGKYIVVGTDKKKVYV